MKNIEAVKINKHGQVSIPSTVRKFLALKPGDTVGFEIIEDGNVILKPVTLIDRRQAWFYTPEIQTKIKSAEKEIKENQGESFETIDETLQWLKK